MKLEQVAFIGRTYQEYLDMFGVSEEALKKGPVLDCPAGPSSFCAEAAQKGIKATAVDVLFNQEAGELTARGGNDIEEVFTRFDDHAGEFVFKYFRDKGHVVEMRRRALELFSKDFAQGKKEGRYVEAGLPALPFEDGAFRMVLSGHFLFLYKDWLSVDDHLAMMREMLRVATHEVRIFPLLGLDCTDHDLMGYMMTTLEDEGVVPEIDEVKYEFQRGGDRVLRLIKKG